MEGAGGAVQSPKGIIVKGHKGIEITDIEQAAITQTYAVNLQFSKTRLMAGGGGAVESPRGLMVEGSKGVTEEEDDSRNKKKAEMDDLYKDKFMNQPIMNSGIENEACKEIPGVPELTDQDGEDVTRPKEKKVFSTYSDADCDRHEEDNNLVSASGDDGLGISSIGRSVGADQGQIAEGGAALTDERFLISQEKGKEESEVAQLMNESLEMDQTSKKRERSSGDDNVDSRVSGTRSADDKDEESDEEEDDVSVLSSLDSYQLCLKYKQLQSKMRSRKAQLQHAREKVKAGEEQQVIWEKERAELEKRVEDSREKADLWSQHLGEVERERREMEERENQRRGLFERLRSYSRNNIDFSRLRKFFSRRRRNGIQ